MVALKPLVPYLRFKSWFVSTLECKFGVRADLGLGHGSNRAGNWRDFSPSNNQSMCVCLCNYYLSSTKAFWLTCLALAATHAPSPSPTIAYSLRRSFSHIGTTSPCVSPPDHHRFLHLCPCPPTALPAAEPHPVGLVHHPPRSHRLSTQNSVRLGREGASQ